MNLQASKTVIVLAAICWIPASSGAEVFTVDLAPYSRTDPGLAEVSRLERGGRIEEAVQLLDLMKENRIECSPDHLPAGVADFMAAGMYERAGLQKAAVARYRAAAGSPLGDVATWRLGGLLSAMGDESAARSAYSSVSTASPYWSGARLALASSLMKEGRPGAASSVLQTVLDADTGAVDQADALLALAEAASQAGDPVRAAAIAKYAFMQADDTRSVKRARALLGPLGVGHEGLLESLRKVSGASRRELKNLDVVARKRPSSLASQDPALPMVIRAAWALSSRADPGRAAEFLNKALAVAENPDVKAFALFLLGELLVDTDDDAGAARAWTRVVSEYPGSPFAAEAGFSGARAWMRTGSHSSAVSLLKLVEDRVPAGGSSLSLRWERALAAMIAGDLPEALDALDAILSVLDHGDGVLFGSAERARYFRGVVLHEMGREDEGRLDLDRVARSSEFAWFGILARARLRTWYGAQFESSAGLPPDSAVHQRGLPAKTVGVDISAVTGLTVTDRSAGALFMLRMGNRKAAEDELVARARRGLLHEQDLLLLALLKASVPDTSRAMRAAAWLRSDFDPHLSWVWTAAYPRPFQAAVLDASAAFNVDEALIYGVMRVESNFRPSVRSPAGAYGLMQLMRQTGRTMVRKVLAPAGIKASAQTPSGNVMIGAALLDRLIVHFDGYLPLVLASYNAGSGSGRRFMRTLGHLPTDLLVEAIPYAQTREYVKRVTGYAGGYRYLYGNSVPLRVGFSVPAGTGPWIDVRSARRPDPDVVANPGGECRFEPEAGSELRPRK